MPAPTFAVVLLWEGSPSPDELATVIASIAELFEGKPATLTAALRTGGAALELVLDLSLYQRPLLNKMKAKVEWSGGHLVEIQRLQEDVRPKFREQYLRPGGKDPQAVSGFGEAARLLREHFSKARSGSTAPDVRAGARSGPVEASGGVAPPRSTPGDAPRASSAPRASPAVARAPEAAPPAGSRPLPSSPAPPSAPPGGGPESEAERRRAPRYAVRLEVAFKTNEAFVREYATNISKGGLFIQTTERPAVNSEVLVVLQLPSGQAVEVGGRVVCHVPGPAPGGVGLAFNERAKSLVALSEYLTSLASV